MTLYLFTNPGCKACEQAKGFVAKFLKKNPELPFIEIDVTAVEWDSQRVARPENTPSYALLLDEGTPVTYQPDHVLTVEQLQKWVYG